MRILPRQKSTISSAWLVRILANQGEVHRCTGCGARMFVAAADGQCPVCRSADARREAAITEIVEEQLDSATDWQ